MKRKLLQSDDALDAVRLAQYPQPPPPPAAAAAAPSNADDVDAAPPVSKEGNVASKKSALVGVNADKTEDQFRNYEAEARETVKEFYRLNHKFQTYEFAKAKKAEYCKLEKAEMSIWEALEFLNTIVDDSDPDTDLSQMAHALQTAEAIRKDGHPRWFVLTGLIHDLGKLLCKWGEPQWAVVGDTFVTGCGYAKANVYWDLFKANPDAVKKAYQSECGIYVRGCGFDAVVMSWGHDEYIYQVCKPYLPPEALAMLRFHSFYAWHRGGAYEALANAHDRAMKKWVLLFNKYDLYTKSHEAPDIAKLKPYYETLIAEFFPPKVKW